MHRMYAVILLMVWAACACAETVVHRPISVGRDYYVVFPKAAWGNQSVGVLINAAQAQKITVTTPTGQKGYINIAKPRTTTYYGGQFRVESVPEVVKTREATRIQSPYPISVHGQFGTGGISGTFTALPVSAWGKEYYAVAPPEGMNSGYFYYPTVYSVPMITIIASHVGTTITVTPTATTAKGREPGVPFTVILPNEGDVYNITTAADPAAVRRSENRCTADLTGTHIVSNYPVGVLCAQSHSSWPCGDNECGDYCVEFIPPVSNWDSVYVITPAVPRIGGVSGEALRLVFSQDGTDLVVDDGNSGPRNMGTFAAGQYYDYAPIGNALVMRGSHPFMAVEFTRKPEGCQTGTSGGENWTLSMVIVSGVNQWGDYVPFSSAYGSQSVGNIYFRQSDTGHIRLNGKRLIDMFPVYKVLPNGFATVPIPVNPASYQELTCDSGATIGGNVFGFGTLRYSTGGDNSRRVLDPEVIKSFAHPIGGSMTPLASHDATPPTCAFGMGCGVWTFVARDDKSDTNATGITDVWIENIGSQDSMTNFTFTPIRAYSPGTDSLTCTIAVGNLALPARCAVRVRDGGGNEFDTVLTYVPTKVTIVPEHLIEGGTMSTTRGRIVVTNTGDSTITYTAFRLRYGVSHHWSIITPIAAALPLVVKPRDSVVFVLQYDTTLAGAFQLDEDTLLVTSCREFALATVTGSPRLPAIRTACYDFGQLIIDTLGNDGEVAWADTSLRVESVGGDTLRVTSVRLVAVPRPNEPTFPESDYTIVDGVDDARQHQSLPTPATPWVIAPGGFMMVTVRAHPHHTGQRNAWILFENNANSVFSDSACLSLTGVIPGVIATSIDYGNMLTGTTRDSFLVVYNTGTDNMTIIAGGYDPDRSTDTAAFFLHSYLDTSGHRWVYYDNTVENTLLSKDTIRVPFRCVAAKPGPNMLRLYVLSNRTTIPAVQLRANVLQPRVAGWSACPPDTFSTGSVVMLQVLAYNRGTDSLILEKMEIAGPRMHEFQIVRTEISHQGLVHVATGEIGLSPAPGAPGVNGDTCLVTLAWTPTSNDLPTDMIRFTGRDRLGRHAADSATSLFYTWPVFPYDTAMPIMRYPCETGIANVAALPGCAVLWPNYPNPFDRTTMVSYTVPDMRHVIVRVSTMMGETVAVLENGIAQAGTHTVAWDASTIRSGIYIIEFITGATHVMRTVVKVR